MRKYSLCLTNYNRVELLLRSFQLVLSDPRIDEVIICDDASDADILFNLRKRIEDLLNPKVKLIVNQGNIGMAANKFKSVSLAQNEWVILFDSDNILGPDYLDALDNEKLLPHYIYMPDFAKPNFDYREFSGHEIATWKAQTLIDNNMFGCLLNTCNYVVNKQNYLSTWEYNAAIKGTDTLWFNYLWLKSGRHFKVVRGMQYEHTVHDGSEWLKHANYNMFMGTEIMDSIKEL